MSKQEDEIRRLQRIRDEQLQARDPKAKDKATSQRLATKHRWSRKKTTVWDVVDDFPAKWFYMLVGVLVGVSAALVLNILVDASWAPMAGGIILLFSLIAGRVIGAIFDWRDDGWTRK